MANHPNGSGYIYVATTKAHPGLVKIGFTTQPPERRIRQFSTGSPLPFILEYTAAVTKPYRVEQAVHALLAHARVSQRREFFSITIQEAVEAIRQVSEETRYRDALAEARATLKAKEVWLIRDWHLRTWVILPLGLLVVGLAVVTFGLAFIFMPLIAVIVRWIDVLANRHELNLLAAELARQYQLKPEDLPIPEDGVLRLLLRSLPPPRLLLRRLGATAAECAWGAFYLSILLILWAISR